MATSIRFVCSLFILILLFTDDVKSVGANSWFLSVRPTFFPGHSRCSKSITTVMYVRPFGSSSSGRIRFCAGRGCYRNGFIYCRIPRSYQNKHGFWSVEVRRYARYPYNSRNYIQFRVNSWLSSNSRQAVWRFKTVRWTRGRRTYRQRLGVSFRRGTFSHSGVNYNHAKRLTRFEIGLSNETNSFTSQVEDED